MIVSRLMIGPSLRFGPAILLASLAGIALLTGSGVVQAGTVDEAHSGNDVYTVTVTYADLDLSSPADADLLHRRIRSAARTVCGWEDKQRAIARDAWSKCYRDAISGALETLDERAPQAAVHKPAT